MLLLSLAEKNGEGKSSSDSHHSINNVYDPPMVRSLAPPPRGKEVRESGVAHFNWIEPSSRVALDLKTTSRIHRVVGRIVLKNIVF